MPKGAITKKSAHEYTSYEDAFPPVEGPPFSLARSLGGPTMVTVTMDAAAFCMMWESTEDLARRRWPTRNSTPSGASLVRAVQELRAVWRHRDEAGTPRQAPADENQP